jgi:hypothetical protein
MPGQLTQYGAEFIGNKFGNTASPFIGASSPGSWIVGQEWINTTGSVLNVYDPLTAAWKTGPYQLYMCLLTSDPTVAGPGGGLAVNISDISPIEDTTPGYLRQPVTFGQASVGEPSAILNTNLMTFGPYTANQALPIGWTALIAVPAQFTGGYAPLASTVLNGLLLYLWQVPNPQQVLSTQSISIAASTFDIGIS